MKKELSKVMNHYLAKLGVEYIKLHHLHWNVVGINFKSIHEYLEGLYDGLADSLDKVAELLKMADEVPAATLKEYLELSSIKELEPKELRFVSGKPMEKPNILLIHCVKYGNPDLRILPPLAVHNEDGSYTEEILKIYEKEI